MEKKVGYIYGSAAPELPDRAGKPAEKSEHFGKTVKAVPKTGPKSAPKRSSIPRSQMIFCVVFVVAVSLLILYRFSAIAEYNYHMGTLTDEYNRLRDENRKLQVDIGTTINLEKVKEIAETKLNMHKPDDYQIVLVSVPKNDYSVVVDQDYIDETTVDTSLIGKFINAVKAVLPQIFNLIKK